MALKYTKELRIGLLAIVAATMLYNGVKFLKGTDFLTRENKYIAVYNNIDGLVEGNAILLNGLNIGRVSKLDFDQAGRNKIFVTLDIDKRIPIGNSTVAQLSTDGFLGGKRIILYLGRDTKAFSGEGQDTLITSIEPNVLSDVSSKLSPLMAKADSAAHALNVLLSDFRQTTVLVNNTLKALEKTTLGVNDIITENKGKLASISSNVDGLTASLADSEKKLKTLISKLNITADSINKVPIAQTFKTADKTLASLNLTLTNINKGQGTLGKMAKNDSLYRNLNASSEALAKLLNDFREKPKRYVHFSLFGSKQK